MAVSICSCISF